VRTQEGASVLTKAVQILETFSAESPVLTASEIARRSELTVPTAHRIALQMLSLGLLERDESLRFRIGRRTWELGSRSQRLLTIREAVHPSLEGVQSVVRHHTQLGVLEGSSVLFVELLSHPQAVITVTRAAARLPVHACSTGLTLLAYSRPDVQETLLAESLVAVTPDTITDSKRLRRELAVVRHQGFAVCYGTVHQDAAGVAVPIFDRNDIAAAISVIVPNNRRATAAALPVLLAAAKSSSSAVRTALARPED
jgi:DNA-binding IclR family transcriptional regulator